MPKLCKSRFAGLYVFGIVFIAISILLRIVLCVHCGSQADMGVWALVKVFAVGTFFDVVTYLCIVLPVTVYLVLAPEKLFHWKPSRYVAMGMYFIAVYLLLFDVASEWFFWDEFGTRYNFVAVDYLVYTHEVVGNILESYPVAAILAVIAVLTTGIVYLTRKPFMAAFAQAQPFLARLRSGAVFLAAPVLSLLLVNQFWANVTDNHFNNELARNGLYSFVAAFRNNVIDYQDYYITRDDAAVFARMRTLLKADNATFVNPDAMDLTRDIVNAGEEKKYNVVILTIESLSAEFLGTFGNTDGLTPNLDALAGQSLLFTNLYASGTRTDRGLESIMMSIPPTPGRSMVKRPENANLFTLGQLFAKRGYELKFIYGGYGYFDNMNNFFEGNGFQSVDRSNLSGAAITFSNAWGVCDEDLFDRVLSECDESFHAHRPFFSLVMSTSNHRPYTYPAKIDIPSGKGRNGAVKYTDYAIGEFLRQAKSREWFANTIFVIVADHCANSAGKTDVPADKYHIPLFIYAPGLVTPAKVDKLASQIDLAPTLLGVRVLNWSYRSKFYGRDLMHETPNRALMGNYQKVGLLVGNRLTVLKPIKESVTFEVRPDGTQVEIDKDKQLLEDTISYYQSASYLLRHDLYSAQK